MTEKEYLFTKDMPIDENGLTNPWHGISREDFENIFLKFLIVCTQRETIFFGLKPLRAIL